MSSSSTSDSNDNDEESILSEGGGPPSGQPSQLLSTQQGAEYMEMERMKTSDKIIQRENEERDGRKTSTCANTRANTRANHGGTLPPTSSGDDDNDVPTVVAKNSTDATTVSTLGTTVADEVVFDTNHKMAPNKYYLRKQRNIKTIFAMAHGVVDPSSVDGDCISTDIEPYSSCKEKKDFKPSLSYFKLEIERRSEYNNQKPSYKHPRPTQWRTDKVMKWLDKNPITSPEQINFIVDTEKDYRDTIHQANNQQLLSQASSASSTTTTPQWCMEKFMRLIHATVEDEIKTAYMEQFTPNTRPELDARRSVNMQRTIPEQLIADKMNDRTYSPTSHVLPDLHDTFADLRDLSYESCMMDCDVTADEVKKKMVDLKGKLVKIIAGWNLSVNGDGNRNLIDEDDEDAGPFEVSHPRYGRFNRELYVDDNRANFTFNYGEVPLYAWQLWDEYELFQTVLVRLDSSQVATTDNNNNNNNNNTEDIDSSRNGAGGSKRKVADMTDFIGAINTQSMAELSKAIRQEQAQVVQYQLQRCKFTNGDPELEILNVAINDANGRAEMLKKKINELN